MYYMSMGNNNTKTYVSRGKATSPQQTPSAAAASESCLTGDYCSAGEPSVPVVCYTV